MIFSIRHWVNWFCHLFLYIYMLRVVIYSFILCLGKWFIHLFINYAYFGFISMNLWRVCVQWALPAWQFISTRLKLFGDQSGPNIQWRHIKVSVYWLSLGEWLSFLWTAYSSPNGDKYYRLVVGYENLNKNIWIVMSIKANSLDELNKWYNLKFTLYSEYCWVI